MDERTKKASRNGRIVEEMRRSFHWGAFLTYAILKWEIRIGIGGIDEEGSAYSEERSLPHQSCF